MLIEGVRRLGEEVEAAWARTDRAIDAFTSIATDACGRFAPHEEFDFDAVGGWLSQIDDLPLQLDPSSKFGDPAITLWRGTGFVIDIYFWIDPETALHDHGFTGAFTNLTGESLHCVYGLNAVERPAPGVILGDLDLQTVERLDRGSIRPIQGGRDFIHRVWHLSRPTVTMCVRTVGQGATFGQYTYFYPRFGIEERGEGENRQRLRKSKDFLAFLASLGDPRLEQYVRDLIGNCDARQALKWVLALHDNAEGGLLEHFALLNRLLDLLEARYGPWIGEFAASLVHRLKEQRVKWHEIHDVDQRFLAAVLLTFGSRDEVSDAIAKHRGANQPIEWAIERLHGMLGAKSLAVVIDDFQFAVLRDLILGRPAAAAVEAAIARDGREQSADDLQRLCSALQQIDIFQPLFPA